MDWQTIKDLKKKKCRPIIQAKNLTKKEKKQTGGEGERERGIFIGHLTFYTDFRERKKILLDFLCGLFEITCSKSINRGAQNNR